MDFGSPCICVSVCECGVCMIGFWGCVMYMLVGCKIHMLVSHWFVH